MTLYLNITILIALYIVLIIIRQFIDPVMRTFDLETMMSRPCFQNSSEETFILQCKRKSFPVMCEFVGTVTNHLSLHKHFQADSVRLRNHEHMYLQVQYHLGCWMHCLFALLGETLHTHFTCSGWIVCTLTSFIDCP